MYRGGGPKEAIEKEVAENIDMYPDPYRWHSLPANGVYSRHVKGLMVSDVVLSCLNRDERPAFALDDVHDAVYNDLNAQKGEGAPQFILKNMSNFSTHPANGVDD